MYTGREPDATGLIYYRSRYYDPQIGRFTQPDPKAFIDGLNQYAYVMNSPVNYVDPWGMNTSSPTVAQDNGGIFASTVNSVRNTASFVGSAINNGLVQPVNTLLNLPNQAADAIAGHFGWSDFDTADERFAAAQSTPIPGDDLVFGALGAVSRAARVERRIGYHATHPEVAEDIMQSGFRQGTNPGRLGSHGTYVNNTHSGAIAEFQFHNPGISPTVIKVDYKPGVNASSSVSPRNYVSELPLNVDSISAPSARVPGTMNTNVLNGTVRPLGIMP